MDFRPALRHDSPQMRRLLTWILPWLALSMAVFFAWQNAATLNPTRLAWLLDGNDHGQAVIGLASYLRSPPPWPSLRSTMLMAPDGIPLALIDSNPLLGLLLRPFASVLPAGIQYLGFWLLACILLHTAFAAALVRRFAPTPLATWIGAALLTLMPVLLARFGHVNLCAQWLILWALWIYVDAGRSARPGWWVAVITAAILIHPYILVMVAAIWASAMLRQAVLAPDGAARTAMIGDVAIVVAPLLIVPLLIGTVSEPTVAVGGYGGFSMALDALWNPNTGTYSALLPARALDPAQALEGMNYLGAGLIVLVAVALFHGIRRHSELRSDGLFNRLAWLLPAFAVLTLVAVAPHLIWRGAVIATLPLPDWAAAALDPIRASGRMFWPVLYTLAFAAIVVVARMRFGTWLLAGALLLQVVDMVPLLASARGSGAAAERTSPYRRTLDPRWDALIARADMVQFEPPEMYRDLALLEEITWRAIVAGKPVSFFYASREPVAVRRRLRMDSAAFVMGQTDPHRLYVLLDSMPPPALASRVRKLDGVSIIPPGPAR
ncbi:DUF6311 domain-containing protein [Sphingomonas sp. QA11]|uniref:DUF6311 domain-containing protein n=1 Tax=Sphingomonas sp. QA11 TaxID=2950605 RepID=UPI00234B1FFE|nr:DUF6311 domain-containing protein [Sphingomonas sp. QA11]WCM27658.1 DUF6311 domain-containing protein [Sphingomonas sp. QA11]